MKKMMTTAAVLGTVLLSGEGVQAQTTINGSGASFPAPVYQNWTYSYTQSTPGVTVNYQSLGSGAGINQIRGKTVDFAGTDNPLTLEEQERDGLMQFPMLTGGVVVIVNIPGVRNNELKLDNATIADIYLGKITRWDDARIKALNPGLRLPNMGITVVRRADSSGTSFIFTNYLSKISKEWEEKVGCGPAVNWPVGIGGQRNPGVCNNVARIQGGIGYTEYTYAVEAKLATVRLQNQTGEFVAPSTESFSAAAANADWKNAHGFYMVLTYQPGKNSWPITGVTYILIRKDAAPAMREAMKKYFEWCFTTGATAALNMHYVPIPENVVALIRKTVLK